MAKNLLAHGEYWQIIQPYWMPEYAESLEAGPVAVGASAGESGLTLCLYYIGPPVEEGDTLSFTATCAPDGEDWYADPVYIYTYTDTWSEEGPVLHELTSTLLPGGAHKEVTVSLPASPDMTFFGWQYAPIPGTYSIAASEGPEPPGPATCFWTDLVGVTQECGSEPAINAAVAYAGGGFSGGALEWSSLAWKDTATYVPPSLPLTYPAAQSVPLLPAGATLTAALASNATTAGGGSGADCSANVSFGTTSITLASTSVTAYTTGSGPRRRSVYLTFGGLDYSGALDDEFLRDTTEYETDYYSLDARTDSDGWSLAMSTVAPGMVTTASVSADASWEYTQITIANAVTPALDHTYSGSGSADAASTILASGLLSSGSMDVNYAASSGGNVSPNPTNVTFSMTSMQRTVSPLRKIVAYLDDVVMFTESQMEGLGEFEFPALSSGEATGKKIALVDNSAYGEFTLVFRFFDAPCTFVGRLVDIDNPGDDLGWVRVDGIPGG